MIFIKKKNKNFFLAIVIFTMLYMSSSYNIAIFSGTFSLSICLLCGIMSAFFSENIKIDKKLFITVMILYICIITTSLFKGDGIKNMIIIIGVIFTSLLFVISIDFKQYCKIYTNIILIIAIYSLITYTMSIISPSIIRLFPKGYYRPGQDVYNLGLSFVNLRPELVRNMGIFWEPGAYQTYLVIAILLELFFLKTNKKYKVIVLFVSLLTTWSTTGIICGLLIILLYIINTKNNLNRNFIKVVILLIIFSIITITIYSFLPSNMQYAIFGKITVYLNSDKTEISSASVRFDSIKYPLITYLKSPIIGVGNSGLQQSVFSLGYQMTTNTVVNWFVAYGSIYGLILLKGLVNLSKKINFNYILVAIIILLSVSTENYLRNISIIIFLLYGLTSSNKERN